MEGGLTYAEGPNENSAVFAITPTQTPVVRDIESKSDWCARIAAGNQGQAKDYGMDVATQLRMSRASYSQCMVDSALPRP